MIEVIKYFAKCNKEINQKMIGIIKASDKKTYDAPVNGYYKSIGDILDHHYIADIIWLNTFKQIHDSGIFADQIFQSIPKWGDRLSRDIETFSGKRSGLDEMIIGYINELSENDLTKEIVRVTGSGETIKRLLWKSLLHMFNHGTHHRGQISQILDGLGIENDYSNMIRIE